MHPKDADGMANSVDPDQTASSEAVWSWSALFAETYLSQYIEFIRYQPEGRWIKPETRFTDSYLLLKNHIFITFFYYFHWFFTINV